jgi:hypothetical protein
MLQPVVCPSISSEYRQVFARAVFQTHGFQPNWLEFLIADSLMLDEAEPWPLQGPDPEDLRFPALAHFPAEIRQNVTVEHPTKHLATLLA